MEKTTYKKAQIYTVPKKVNISDSKRYDLYPAYPVEDKIYCGFDIFAQQIASNKLCIIDLFEGVFVQDFIESLNSEFNKLDKSVKFHNVSEALKSEVEIYNMIKPYMGEESSIFGTMTDLKLIDYFDKEKLYNISIDYENYDINIVYGCGASLCDLDGLLIYVDLPKNELQFRMAAGDAYNLGCLSKLDGRESYKRCYFVDWPILDTHKGELLPKIDWIVDEQRGVDILFMKGDTLRAGLDGVCHNSFRVRPWFAPGVWGGTYLGDNIDGLSKDVDNYAWSFELMTLENGIMFGHDGYRLEVSFIFVMYHNYKAVLGRCAEDFKYDFPIRFDFLDTVNGGNLSVQCHPRPEYIRREFGKKYTQDETYYILKTESDAKVYLGFQDEIDENDFAFALNDSLRKGEKIEIEKYVRKFSPNKHDLFLIPNGAIHASGSGNLVLEISSAPYIFTFKMYDWMRLDLDGRLRPINIDHGLKNVRFEFKGETVDKELICKPVVISQRDSLTIEHLPTHPVHFYDVHRYTIQAKSRVEIETNDSVHVLMVVEGQSVVVKTKNGMVQRYSYLETFVVPAAAGSYVIENDSDDYVMLVKSYVKDSYVL